MRTTSSFVYKLFYAQMFCLFIPVALSIILLCSSLATLGQEVLVGLTSTGGPDGAGTSFNLKTTGASFIVHRNFVNAGNSPYGDLVKGKDGFFYGMTPKGGLNGSGTIFRMSSTGLLSFVTNLNYANTGIGPHGSLIQGADGNFYGMTNSGGTNSYGTIFKVTSTGIITVLKNLDGANTGGFPFGSLIQAKDSNFYGMTYQGGTNNFGTIFKVTPAGVLTVLKNLDNTTTGSYPYGNLIQGTDGNFYGMTSLGGSRNFGTIFRITSTGSLTVLKNLDYNTTGANPQGSLIQATDGNFYGMTSSGSANGFGTIFKITSTGTLTVIKNLDNTTGLSPLGSLVQGTDGNLYGMCQYGGTNNYGTVFKITPTGTLTVLKNLDNTTTGGYPHGSLFKNSDGYFYGMTIQGAGGHSNGGLAFKISTTGTFTILFRFDDGGFGQYPSESLIQAKDGNYYGMANQGGKNGAGTIYKLCTSGTLTTLRFLDYTTTGSSPYGSLIQAKDGNFYGMTSSGGTHGFGTIFKVTSSGVLTVLKNLDDTTAGSPYGSLIQATDGNFYGMSSQGGTHNFGTIFKITSTGTLTVLKNLDNTTTGGTPYGSLIQASDGNFYGMTSTGGSSIFGTIFKITSTGTFTVIKNLDNITTGGSPSGSLIQATDGNFYGMTSTGGSSNHGAIFKITPTGTLTVLKNLDQTNTGSVPLGDLVQGSDGTLYGMTQDGGTYTGGTIFKITTTGTFTVLRHLNPASDGANPTGNLVIQKPNPVANPQTVSTHLNTVIKIILTGAVETPLTFAVSTKPLHGTATILKDTLTYTPTTGYSGPDSLFFTANWGCQKSVPAKIKITVLTTAPLFVQSNASVANEEKKNLSGDGKLAVTVYPNPSTDYFTITTQSSSMQPLNIRVVDEVGRIIEVINNASANGTIRIGERYQNGLYFTEVIQGKERVSLKLMKGVQ